MGSDAEARWSRRANLITSPFRAVGGRLFVDDSRLRFEPNAVDRALAGKAWSVGLDEITAVEAAPRRPFSHVFGAGLRRQLRVEGAGAEAYFIVNRVDEVVAELRALTNAR